MRGEVAIAGGGPAGSSLAIRLAKLGFRVRLLEREFFPREKLCGEFISPECMPHFDELGVGDAMRSAGGTQIEETVFYTRKGASIVVPSRWLHPSGTAIGLSRAAMDLLLLEKAENTGVEVHTGTLVTACEQSDGEIREMRAKKRSGGAISVAGDIFVDATGRSAVLSKLASTKKRKPKTSEFVAFKAHLSGTAGARNTCEIYSFDHGYGGLNSVEQDRANFCFIVRSREVKKFGSDPERLFRSLLSENVRARLTLAEAVPLHEWLAVAVDSFGKKNLRPAANVFSAGDAGAFIDPFTGSGILMSLESSRILASAISEGFPDTERISSIYKKNYEGQFSDRLGISSLIRLAAYRPRVASVLISLLSASRSSRRLLARATRGSSGERGEIA